MGRFLSNGVLGAPERVRNRHPNRLKARPIPISVAVGIGPLPTPPGCVLVQYIVLKNALS
jgi:hypothetical protein